MNERILSWLKTMRSNLPTDLGRVLEVGSLNINGSPREVLKTPQYIGLDIQEGKDVDVVANAHDIVDRFGKDHFDVVVNMNMLEHDDYFWKTLMGINGVLKPGGYHIFCAPTFGFPIHRHPKDYWRFGEDAVREVIFKGYDLITCDVIYTKEKEVNPVICALGQKQ